MSIEATFLNDVTDFVDSQVGKVVVNNSIEKTSFLVKQVADNVFEIQFTISSAETGLITNIKLAKSDDTVISSNDVNIPITDDEVIIRQTITISEVV